MRLLLLKPLLSRANRDVVVIVLCRVSFLFLLGVPTGDSLILRVVGVLFFFNALFESVVEDGFEYRVFGGRDPDLLARI